MTPSIAAIRSRAATRAASWRPARTSEPVLIGAAAVALVLGCGHASGGAREAAPPDALTTPLATVVVHTTHPGGPVPDTFLGISCEWSSVTTYLGDGAGGANPAVVRLLSAFAAEGNHPTLRIGGNSADRAWWNPSGTAPRPANVTIDVGAAQVSTLAALQAALGATLIPDLNLALQGVYTDAASNAAGLVQALLAALPPGAVRAFELGNEPDLWSRNGLRPSTYLYADWKNEYGAFTAALSALVVPAPPIAAPALSGTPWLPNLDDLSAARKANLSLATAHRYPFNVCKGKAPPAVADLLADAAGQTMAMVFAPHVAAARQAGIDFRVDETNTVACGGADGVSNVYAAALWGADVAFQLASVGAVGLNFHTPGRHYGVFRASGTSASVQPLYYGMRLFSIAVPAGARLAAATVSPPLDRLHAWATVGPDGRTRVALLNLDPGPGGTVTLNLAGAGAATAIRLHAATADARDGITLGGQTWDGSTDGSPQGDAVTETLIVSQGTTTISLAALDAVVVTLR